MQLPWITQRAILRAAVPVVGIGISATWNYVATNLIATAARHGLRATGRLRDAVGDVARILQAQPDDAVLVLESMLTIITADGNFDQYEQEVFNCVVRQLKVPPNVLTRIEQPVDITAASVEQQLRAIDDQDLRTTLATCLQLVAIADGEVVDLETQLLRRYMAALHHDFDLEQLHAQAKQFQPPANWAQQAGNSISEFSSSVGSTVTSWFAKRSRQATEQPDVVPVPKTAESDGPLEQIRKLAVLHTDGILSDIEFQAKKQELLARL